MPDFTIRVGTFNLRHANMNDPAPNNWANRRAVAASHIRTSGASVVGLQECSYMGTPDSQAQQLVDSVNALTGGAWQLIWPAELGNLAVMYDSAVVEPSRPLTRIRVNEKYTLGGNRYMIYTPFSRKAGGSFVFANTHWHHDDPDAANGQLRRAESATIVASQLNTLRTTTGLPVILTGDFNTGAYGSGAPRQTLINAGYSSVALEVSATNSTYNSYNGFDVNMTGRVNGNWIDGVHVSGLVTVNSAGQVLSFANGSTLPLSSPLPSDHNLVYTSLTMSYATPPSSPVTMSDQRQDPVYPPRNLGPAEHWGRTVEGRVEGVAREMNRAQQSLSGTNRYTASSSQTISRNAAELRELTEAVRDAILTFPQYFATSVEESGFSVGTNWTTVATLSIPRPAGFTQLDLTAQATTLVLQEEGSFEKPFIWPFSLSTVTSEFGPRPPLPFHNGIDFGVGTGTTIPASGSGTILLKGYYEDWGNYIRIRHPNIDGKQIWTGYAHMRELPSYWSLGDSIQQGQRVGYVGSTGFVTGPHLHFETAVDGTRIDPRSFMTQYGGTYTPPQPTQARIVINGSASLAFEATRSDRTIQLHSSLWGVSGTAPSTTTVNVQVRSTSSALNWPGSRATLTVTGGFST